MFANLNVHLNREDIHGTAFGQEELVFLWVRRICLIIHGDSVRCREVPAADHKEHWGEAWLQIFEREPESNLRAA